jgi:hypothetical protein
MALALFGCAVDSGSDTSDTPSDSASSPANRTPSDSAAMSQNEGGNNTSQTPNMNTGTTPTQGNETKSAVIDRDEIRKYIDDGVTFEDLEAKYDLEKDLSSGLLDSFGTISGIYPEISFNFGNSISKPEVFTFKSLSGPASAIFPEYVGMTMDADAPLDKPPYVLEIRGGFDVQMSDDYGYYQIVLSKPGILSADDLVVMYLP